MEHVTIKEKGDFYELIPDKGYMLRDKATYEIFSRAVTKNIEKFEVIEVE